MIHFALAWLIVGVLTAYVLAWRKPIPLWAAAVYVALGPLGTLLSLWLSWRARR